MAKVSIQNITDGIYEATAGKTGKDLELALKNTVQFLNKKNLLSQSEAILSELEKLINKKEDRIKIKVRSAIHISESKRHELEHEMKEKYKAKHVESEYFEDKNLLGGMKIEVGEDVLDSTYRNKLNQLEKVLIQK